VEGGGVRMVELLAVKKESDMVGLRSPHINRI
jgi:hypothetical protein